MAFLAKKEEERTIEGLVNRGSCQMNGFINHLLSPSSSFMEQK